jgi:hypothetical protein
MPQKAQRVVCFNYSVKGYVVQVWEGKRFLTEYAAGNVVGDSKGYVHPGDAGALPIRQIAKLARSTARAMADEFKAKRRFVTRDQDMEV